MTAILTPEDWLLQRTIAPSRDQARDLRAHLAEASLTADIVLLARDAASTLGRHLLTLRHGWPGGASPFQRLFVADLGSTDGTREITEEGGAVFLPPDAPRATSLAPAADGDGLVRAIAASNADILLVLPADLTRIDLDGIAAIVDSFRLFPSLLLSQGFRGGAGCALSRHLARPLLSTLLPELGLLADPACPVLALRRSAFLAPPIARTSGYEASLVVEAWKQGGLESLAQVRLSRLERVAREDSDDGRSFRCALALLESLRRSRRLSTPQEFGHISSTLVDQPSGSLLAKAHLMVFPWNNQL